MGKVPLRGGVKRQSVKFFSLPVLLRLCLVFIHSSHLMGPFTFSLLKETQIVGFSDVGSGMHRRYRSISSHRMYQGLPGQKTMSLRLALPTFLRKKKYEDF